MKNFARLYQAKQALVVHAAATPYRERSHFDGQDVLESGLPGVGKIESGWLNRALQKAPAAYAAVSIGPAQPLILRGAATLAAAAGACYMACW
mgnify:CR=1 FL=1